jgi:hypothetical protein
MVCLYLVVLRSMFRKVDMKLVLVFVVSLDLTADIVKLAERLRKLF